MKSINIDGRVKPIAQILYGPAWCRITVQGDHSFHNVPLRWLENPQGTIRTGGHSYRAPNK